MRERALSTASASDPDQWKCADEKMGRSGVAGLISTLRAQSDRTIENTAVAREANADAITLDERAYDLWGVSKDQHEVTCEILSKNIHLLILKECILGVRQKAPKSSTGTSYAPSRTTWRPTRQHFEV